MRRTTVSWLILPLLLSLSCSSNKVKLPIATSLGNLITIEQKNTVETSDGKITRTPEEVLYLLTFEGKNEIVYEGLPQYDGPFKHLLIDSKGAEFSLKFAGTPTKNGIISNSDWLLKGKVEFTSEGSIFKGTATLPEPRLTLIYLVPKGASGLTLKDGNQRHPIN